jgi:hypothetical protein
MPTFSKPSLDVDEAFEALRSLVHATRSRTTWGIF